MKAKLLLLIIAMFLIVLIVFAAVPTHNDPSLQEAVGAGETNLTVINQSGADGDGNIIVFNTCFYSDGTACDAMRWENHSAVIEGFYPFDQNSVDDFTGQRDGTNTGAEFIDDAQVNGGFDFVSANTDWISTASSWVTDANDPITIMFWAKANDLLNARGMVCLGGGGATPTCLVSGNLNGGILFEKITVCNIETDNLLEVGVWIHFALVHEGGETSGSKTHFYKNGVEVANDGTACTPDYSGGGGFIGVNSVDIASPEEFNSWSGGLDEVQIYSTNLSAAQIRAIYNGTKAGFGVLNASDYDGTIANYRGEMTPYDSDGNAGTPKNDSIGLSIISTSINNTAPRKFDHVNFSINFSASNVSGYVFSWDNGTENAWSNTTFVDLLSKNLTLANVSVFKTVLNNSNVTISYKWYLNDTNGIVIVSDTFTFLVAGVDAPTLTISTDNFFATDNSTIINVDEGKTVLINLSFEDDIALFGFEMNITSSDGVCYNITNTGFGGKKNANFTAIVNVTADCTTEGFHNVSITGWDTHTALSIRDYDVEKGKDYLLFDGTIRITAEKAKSSNSIKRKDRYEFSFEYSKLFTPSKKVFYIESNGKLYYIWDSKYKAHFVDWESKRWIDFEGIDALPIITKINDNRYKIEFDNDDDKLIFSSIGGLNSRTDEYRYFLGNVIVDWFIPSTTTEFFINGTISVSLSVDGSTRNETRFRLYNVSKNLIDSFNISNDGAGEYFYNTTFTGLVGDTFYINATHHDTLNILTNSTTLLFSNAVLNITFKDEILDTILTGLLINLDVAGETFAQNFTTINGNIGVVGWTPGEYRLTYNSELFGKRDFYISLDDVVNFSVTLYLLSITNATDVTFTVQDNSGTELENATIRLKRYYVSTNSYRTIAMSRTNFEGKSIIDIDFNDPFYETFTTFQDLSLRTQGAKIIATTLILTMKPVTDPFTNVDTIEDVITSLSFNDLTETFSYVFTDTTGANRKGTLVVIEITPTTETIVCTETDTTSSGTLLCQVNITNSTGSVSAKGFIQVGSTSILTDTISKASKIVRDLKDVWGSQGVFFSILVAGTMGGLGMVVSPATGIIMFLAGLLLANFFGMTIMGTVIYGFFILAAVLIIWKMKR